MLILKLNVRNQRLSKFNSSTIASNSVGYLYCQFNCLTRDWDDVSVKMANFSYKGRNYPVLVNENNICEVPKEVIKPNGVFGVSLFGGGITTNMVKYEVEDSGITPYDDESISVKYYNEIINKLTAHIDELNETKADNIVLNKETNTIQLSANGNPIGDTVARDGEGVSSDCTGIYVPNVTEDNMLIFTLQDTPSEEKLEFDIDKSNDWHPVEDEAEESNYLWTEL